MKTLLPTLLPTFGLALACTASSWAQGPGAAAAPALPAHKTYYLFQGDNIAIDKDGKIYPVVDVSGGAWVIQENGADAVVSAQGGPVAMRDTPSSKLSEIAAAITHFKTEGAYTWANDPAVRLTRGMASSAQITAGADAAANQAAAANTTAAVLSGASATPSSSHGSGTEEDVGGSSAMNPVGSDNDLYLANAGKVNTEGYDALKVDFSIASEHKLPSPYLVVFTYFRDPGAAPNMVRKLVYAKALAGLTATPEKVEFTIEGFPVGYVLSSMEVHLYDRGQEVATNLSPKRQEMTSDQAFDYVLSKYLAAHKDATLPAVPAMGDLPPDLHERIAKGEYATPVFVKVSKDGVAAAAYSDQTCTRKINDPYLTSVVEAIRFKPALDHGNPVDSVSQLTVARLRI